jgi:quercetin dioxygenase-like cupin family protein
LSNTFRALGDLRPYVLLDGITARAVNGERMTMAVVDLDPDLVMPEHHHENEQLGFIITGSLTFHIGAEARELGPGDTYSIPSHVPHHVVVGPDGCTVVDVFAPVRADWESAKRLAPSPGRWP